MRGFYLIVILGIMFFAYQFVFKQKFAVKKRLGFVREVEEVEDESGEDVDALTNFIEGGSLYKIPLIGSFYRKQMESLVIINIQMKPKEYFIMSVGLFIGFTLIGSIATGQIVIGPVLGVLGMLIPNFYIEYLKKKRNTDLNEQLSEFLNTLSNALRSGLSFQQGIDISTEDAQDPVKWEFQKLLNDMSIGRTTEDALESLKDRTQNENIDLLVNSINVQMEVGGNLSEILDLLSHTIRENAKLQRYFKSTIAQNKLSGIIIGFLPIALAVVLTFTSPEYMSPLFEDTLGRLMLFGAVCMISLGLFIVKKITELEV